MMLFIGAAAQQALTFTAETGSEAAAWDLTACLLGEEGGVRHHVWVSITTETFTVHGNILAPAKRIRNQPTVCSQLF